MIELTMKDDEIMSMISQRRSMYGINNPLLQDMDVYYLDRYKDDVDYKHNNQVLNINHLDKIRLLESKIEEVQQMRLAVRGPTESEVGMINISIMLASVFLSYL